MLVTASGRCVSDNCLDCIYNINPQVVGLGSDFTGANRACPSRGLYAIDNYPVVYLDQAVYSGVPAHCTPPCRLVFPPSSLPTPTTITILEYRTSLEVQPGITTTITVTISKVVVTIMSFLNVVVSSG